MVSDQEIHKLMLTKGILIKLVHVERKGRVQLELHPRMQPVLQKCAEPIGLPPKRACDHKMPIQPGYGPISGKAYSYSYFQKAEIERTVSEMLSMIIVRHSNSLYSLSTSLPSKINIQFL